MTNSDSQILDSILADGPIAALVFRTGGGTSRSVRAFIAEFATMLTPTGPLIYTTDRQLVALFRFFRSSELHDARNIALNISGGQRFPDVESEGGVYIDTKHGSAAQCNIEFPEGGKWREDRTPENTPRHVLPVFDSTRGSQQVIALLERWSDRLVDIHSGAHEAPCRSWAEPEYMPGTSIGVDPMDWDPTDPRRRDHGLIEKVRRLRREFFGGRDSREVIEGPESQSLAD